MVIVHHPLYLKRLATVYLDIYDRLGFDSARHWFKSFLTEDFRKAVKPYIEDEAKKRGMRTE